MDMTSYNILLKACCKAKRVDLAQDIYKEIKHMASTRVLKLDVITYSTMIKVMLKCWRAVTYYMHHPVTTSLSISLLSLAFSCKVLRIYLILVFLFPLLKFQVLADAKMWQMALNIKEDMLLADVSPNIVTWSSLISAFANAGLVDRAIQMFDEMLMAGCEPNAQCCNILLDACVKSCQYDRAFRFFYSWKESGFKIFRTTKGKTYSRSDLRFLD